MRFTHIQIQQQDFNQGAEYERLRLTNCGAIVTFCGLVREFSDTPDQSLWLEHYEGMAQSILQSLVTQAADRFGIEGATLIHRVGRLQPAEQIVFVGVASRHRRSAFEAAQFIMDYLKTEAPFWKKEGADWVTAKSSDEEARKRW